MPRNLPGTAVKTNSPDRVGGGHWAAFAYGVIVGFGIALLAVQFGFLGGN